MAKSSICRENCAGDSRARIPSYPCSDYFQPYAIRFSKLINVLLSSFSFPKSNKFTGATPMSVSGNKPAPVVNLNSGWDDMLNSKKSKGWAMLAKPRANTLTSPPASPEPSTSGHTITTREDSGLVKPSIYVTPIAKPNVVNHPPPPVAPPPPTLLQVPIRKDTPKKSKGDGKPGSSIPDDVGSMTSSIWTAPWPEPPADYPNSNHQRSLSSSSSDTFGYPLYPIVASDPSR